jgi:hypothetical protein
MKYLASTDNPDYEAQATKTDWNARNRDLHDLSIAHTLLYQPHPRHVYADTHADVDFATLKWPHFDHYIWPHPNR